MSAYAYSVVYGSFCQVERIGEKFFSKYGRWAGGVRLIWLSSIEELKFKHEEIFTHRCTFRLARHASPLLRSA